MGCVKCKAKFCSRTCRKNTLASDDHKRCCIAPLTDPNEARKWYDQVGITARFVNYRGDAVLIHPGPLPEPVPKILVAISTLESFHAEVLKDTNIRRLYGYMYHYAIKEQNVRRFFTGLLSPQQYAAANQLFAKHQLDLSKFSPVPPPSPPPPPPQ